MPRRSYWLDQNMDSISAIERKLHSCSTSFAVNMFRSRKTGQVLYLEAGKEFVDTLLSFLLLPVGNIIHMLSEGVPQPKHVSGFASIFESVKKLDSSLLHVDRNRILAQPRRAANDVAGLSKSTTSIGLLQLCLDADAKKHSPQKKRLYLPAQFYKCNDCTTLSSTRGARCCICSPENRPYTNHRFLEGPYFLSAEDLVNQEAIVSLQDPIEEPVNLSTGKGFVKDNITFMVTDKLDIMPSTTITSMSVLHTLNVASLADLESNKVAVTITQVLELLQSALTASKSCLNDVFGIRENTTIPGETSSPEIDQMIAGLHIQGLTSPK